jgi:biotin carboxylase
LKKKLAILGATYLQKPLVQKANDMGLETHVFAWKEGNVVKDICHFFYDISILEKEEILRICESLSIDGIISVASDAAMPTVNYVANKLNLIGNSIWCSEVTTDKFRMRDALSAGKISIPKYCLVTRSNSDNLDFNIQLPLIVKPVDRSGSRGVTLINEEQNLQAAINKAITESFSSKAIVEEYIDGLEFSVEAVSIKGVHTILAITEKTTTGAPHFVELAHKQPAKLTREQKIRIEQITLNSLACLQIENGMSHTELKLAKGDVPVIIEVAARMGGDFIGSVLTTESSGIDTLKLVIDIALNRGTEIKEFHAISAVKQVKVEFNICESRSEELKYAGYDILNFEDIQHYTRHNKEITSSSERYNYIIYKRP